MGWNTDVQTMLEAVTVDETTSLVFDVSRFKDWSITITISDDTFTSGEVTIEGTDDREYGGTFAVLATANEAATIPTNPHSSVLAQDAKLVVSGTNLAVPYVRARISEAIVGGATATVTIYARN
jgi:hypothetical protein